MKLRGDTIMKRKNLLLTLGTIASVVSPIAAVVSCGQETTTQTTNASNVLVVPSDYSLPAVATDGSKIDLDDILANGTKEQVLTEMRKFFTGGYAVAHLNGEDTQLSEYVRDQKFQMGLKSFVYKLSQKFPKIIISTPNGESLFSANAIVDVAALNAHEDADFLNNISILGGGQQFILADNFPKAPAHAHYEFRMPELIPEITVDKFNTRVLRDELAQPGTPWVLNINGIHVTSMGHFVAPTEIGKEFTINIILKSDKGYVQNAYFEKNYHMVTSQATVADLTKGLKETFFADYLFSMDEARNSKALSDTKAELMPIIDAAKKFHKYSFAGSADSTNFADMKTAVLAAIKAHPSHGDINGLHDAGNVGEAAYNSMVQSPEDIPRAVHALEQAGYFNNIAVSFDDVMDEYFPGGAHSTKTATAADPGHTGFASFDAFKNAVRGANSLKELKDITDKFGTHVNALSSFDYTKHFITIDGVSELNDLDAKLAALTSMGDLQALFTPVYGSAKLPPALQARTIAIKQVTS